MKLSIKIRLIIIGILIFNILLHINLLIVKVGMNFEKILLKYKHYLNSLDQKYLSLLDKFLTTYTSIFTNYINSSPYYFFYYLRTLIFISFITFLIILFKKKSIRFIDHLVKFYQEKKNKNEKRVILIFIIPILYAGIFRVNIGYTYGGILGWDESGVKSSIIDTLSCNYPLKNNFFSQGVVKKNLKYLAGKKGYIKTGMIFIEDERNEYKIINYGIFNGVFPELIYGDLFNIKFKHDYDCLILSHVKKNILKRKKGFQNLLPEKISYNFHTPYRRIDYSNYPEKINSIKSYEVVFKLYSNSKIELVGGKLLNIIKCID